MKRPSLRWIFLIPILVTISIGFTVFAVYVDRVERANRIADIDAELVRAEGGAIPVGRGAPAVAPPQNRPAPIGDVSSPVQLVVDRGSVVLVGQSGNPFSPATMENLVATTGFTTVDDENYRVKVARRPNGPISVTALSLELVDDATADFRQALAVGGGVIVVLVAAVAWQLVRSLTRPITDIAAAANRIADGQLDTSLDASSRSREVTALSADLDRMLARLTSTLAASDRSAAEATRARDDMQRFLADMAHELRTPLTALKGYSDLYAGGMLEEKADVDRAMSRVGSESERLNRLADDMLQLARHGIADEATERLDVAAIAASVASDLRAANPDHTIDLHAASGSHVVIGSPARIHQAILNLGANACHHGGPSPVALDISSDGTFVHVRVVDHGPGVDAAERDRIFLPFYRVDTSRSRSGQGGAGIGLALTNQIAAQHAGTLGVETTPGGGATFVLSLPAAEPEPA